MNINPMTPITSVKVLQAVPLDNSYKDTLTFENVSGQTFFFTGKAKATYTNLSPINLYNSIRLPVCADDIYDCNYIMFQNANFKTKWFYAFITKINYVNPNMCQVEFEIDVMQTWYFDYTINPCYIEREHTNNDTIGNNLIPENVSIGEYVNEPKEGTNLFTRYVACGSFADAEKSGGVYAGMYTGVPYEYWSIETDADIDIINKFLGVFIESGTTDSIVSTFLMPEAFATKDTEVKSYTRSYAGAGTKIGQYTPINKKLLTYPYTFLYVTNQEGQSKDYRFEYFQNSRTDGRVEFEIYGSMGNNPEILCVPKDYNRQSENIDESLSLGNFPQFAFSCDTYRAWLAQNANGALLAGLSSGATLAGGIASANPALITSGVFGLANIVNDTVKQSYKADSARGTQGSSILMSTRKKDYAFYNRHIREDIAKSIDDYFSMYGYATEVTKKPNITGRKSWNYVKTKDSKITGSIPFEDIEKIRSIFDNGVTFWHGDFVGHYERDNSIIGG